MSSNDNILSNQERNALNYAPIIEYELPRINASDYSGPTATYVNPGSLVQPVMLPLWDKTIDILTNLAGLEDKISNTLLKDKVSVTKDQEAAVIEALKSYGHTYEGTISFPIYKEVLTSPDSYGKNIIIDTYENYHADVNGKLNAELYTDVVDMLKDWESMLEFIKKALFAQVVPVVDLPSSIKKDDASLAKIDKAEKELIDAFTMSKKAYEISLASTREAYLKNPDSESFYNSEYETTQMERLFKRTEGAVHSKTEIFSLVDSKALETEVLTALINNTVDYEPYKNQTLEILMNLIRQYPSRQSAEKGLRKIQALIKLSVDGKADSTANTKNDIRSISSQPNKDRMNQALSNGVHLRNNVFGEVHEVMDYFDGIPEEESGFSLFAEHIVDGVVYADEIYEAQSADFYKIHSLDSELRRQKLVSVIDKHSSREVYQLLEKVLSYATETNSWPTSKDMSSWLQSFMAAKNLT